MTKKFLGWLCCLIAVFAICSVSLSPINASADTGPKPSVRIVFENMGEQDCYGTLLSKYRSTGPASAWDGEEDSVYLNGLDREIWEAFVNYEDGDHQLSPVGQRTTIAGLSDRRRFAHRT